MSYPGDLELRAGRRVCRKSARCRAVPIDETAKAQDTDSWFCGDLREIHGDQGHIKVFRMGWWSYPLVRLRVNHSQEIMTADQYIYALTKLRQIVAHVPLRAYDDTTIGDKSTECNWGLCNDSKEVWPIGRPHRQKHQPCPLDRERREHIGCFYRCHIFQRGWRNREGVLYLYDFLLGKIMKGVKSC